MSANFLAVNGTGSGLGAVYSLPLPQPVFSGAEYWNAWVNRRISRKIVGIPDGWDLPEEDPNGPPATTATTVRGRQPSRSYLTNQQTASDAFKQVWGTSGDAFSGMNDNQWIGFGSVVGLLTPAELRRLPHTHLADLFFHSILLTGRPSGIGPDDFNVRVLAAYGADRFFSPYVPQIQQLFLRLATVRTYIAALADDYIGRHPGIDRSRLRAAIWRFARPTWMAAATGREVLDFDNFNVDTLQKYFDGNSPQGRIG